MIERLRDAIENMTGIAAERAQYEAVHEKIRNQNANRKKFHLTLCAVIFKEKSYSIFTNEEYEALKDLWSSGLFSAFPFPIIETSQGLFWIMGYNEEPELAVLLYAATGIVMPPYKTTLQ